MSFVAAAIVGGSVIGAGASIYGANKAADAQSAAANSAIAAQMSMFNQSKEALQPFIDYGQQGTKPASDFLDYTNPDSPLAKLLKLTTPGADMSAALEQTPGYQFSLNQGQKAVQNSLAARGLGGPGGALAKGGAQFAEGLAGNTWQNVVQALQNAFSSGSNALQNRVQTGSSAASSLAGNATTTGQGVANNLIGAGNAQAAADTAIGSAVGNVGNSVSSAILLNKILGNGANNSQAGLYQTAAGPSSISSWYNV